MTTTIIDPRKGKPSASSAWRRRNCPGSRNAIPLAGMKESTELADEGTLIHKALETGDYSALNDEQLTIAERLTEMAERSYHNWLQSIPEDNRKNIKEYKEERFWILHPTTGEEMESSQVDIAYVVGDRGYICDFKTGFLTATPSPKNYQLRVAALAMWNTFPKLKEITVAVAQVRFKSNYNECTYTKSELLMAQQEWLLADWISQQPDAPFSAGPWCDYCPIKSNCRTAAAYSMLTVGTLALTPDSSKEAIQDRVNDLTLPALAKLHSYASITVKVLDAVKARLKSVTEEERNANGLTMGAPSKVATIADIPKAGTILIEELQAVTEQEFNASLKLTLGTVEKIAIGRLSKRNEISQKVAKEQLREALKDCIVFSEKAASLEVYVPEARQIEG